MAEQGRPVPHDELAEALWGDSPPATWEKALTVLVSKLRALLADGGVNGNALTGAFGCYRLDLPEGSWVDVIAAATGARQAEQALAAGELETARTRAALAAKLSEPRFLPGEDGAWVEEKRRELADIRAGALTTLSDACLLAGDAQAAAKWADEALALEPFRETGYRRLMQAHAAAGNRAEALRVYERCRRLLAEELGAYPSPETESIYRDLLAAPAPDRHRSDSREPPSVSRRRLVFAAVTVVAAAAVVAAILNTRSGAAHVTVAANSLVALNPSGSIEATAPVGARPVAITSRAGSLWVANFDDRSVTRVDLSSRRAVRTVPIASAPTGLTATKTAVWVDGARYISKIDPSYNQVTARRPVGPSTLGNAASAPRPMIVAFGWVWVGNPDGYVSRIDPNSGRRAGSVDVGNDPSGIAAGSGSVWVTNKSDGTVTRIDPNTLLTTTIPVGHGPAAVAINHAGAWIANAGDSTVVRVDPETNVVTRVTPVGDGPSALLATPSGVWVANASDGTVTRLDPRSGKVDRTIHLGGAPDAFVAAAGTVWVAVAPAPPPPPVTGGVAHFTEQEEIPSLDPALDPAGFVLYATCANLVTYPDQPGPEGTRIVPEVAEAIPTPTAGGTTYTFTIRPGFRFSPPSNEAVTASTFKSTIERVTNPRLKSPYANQFSGIVGYRAYVQGKAHELSGVVAHGRTLTIRLSRPDGAFLADLAGGAACAVPRDTPALVGGINDIPSAGPYYIASYTPREQWVLKRNPNYRGDRPHRLDQIVVASGISSSRALTEIEAGKADHALDGLLPVAGQRLESEYGPGSKAAKEGHQQYFVNAANGEFYLHMNTSRPLFSHARLRRAVSYAIDRTALAAQARRFAGDVNPFNPGEPTDDYLPPSTITGARDFRLYPLRPDVSRARQIAGRLRATAVMYSPNGPPWRQEAEVVRRDLKPLGIDVQVKEFPGGDFFTRIARRGEPFDLAISGWAFESTDPADDLEIFDGSTIRPTGNSDFSYFDDPAFNRKLKAAAKLSGRKRYREYARLELELERDLVPAAAFAVDASRDFFSARIGCQMYQPVYGIDLAALCLRR